MREILRQLMEAHHHNPSQLAVISGVPQSTIQRFLAGTIKKPHSHTLKRLADAYGVTEDQLRGDAPLGAGGAGTGETGHPMGLSSTEQLLVRAYRMAPPDAKLTLIEIAHNVLLQYGQASIEAAP